jgi:hypothetical protein
MVTSFHIYRCALIAFRVASELTKVYEFFFFFNLKGNFKALDDAFQYTPFVFLNHLCI